LEVAFGLFAMALAGLGPLIVYQSRHLQVLQQSYDDRIVQHLVPNENPWARKLGVAATFAAEPPAPEASSPFVIDDEDGAYAQIDRGYSDWHSASRMGGSDPPYQQRFSMNFVDGAGDRAVWSFSPVPPGRYDVYVTFPWHSWFAENAPFRIYDDDSLLDTVRVNQRQPPPIIDHDGVRWMRLGSYVTRQGTLRVTLGDDAKGWFIAADAVRVVPLRNRIDIHSAQSSAVDDAVTVHATVTPPEQTL
jgi:hypothetical protein